MGATKQPLFETAAEQGAGEFGGFFAGERQVADDDADAAAVERLGDGVVEGPFAGVKQQVEERIEPGGGLRIDAKAGQFG